MGTSGREAVARVDRGIDAQARPVAASLHAQSNKLERATAQVVASAATYDLPASPIATEGARQFPEVDEIDAARAREYALLSTLLARAPTAALLKRLSELRGDATPLGVAHAALAEAASRADVTRVEREYFELFIGIGRGELLPYGSFYISGFLYERPLARLRAHLDRLGIERSAGQSEPEDHAAILCEIMAKLISGDLPAPAGADRELFEQHLQPWIGRFFADLEQANAADFYQRVASVGRVLVSIETEAFALPS